jgi:hypothetical protein
MSSFVQEKVDQAIGILREKGIDLWLTFVQETIAHGDPVLPLIFGDEDLTWQSALILTRSGERIAIVGQLDAEMVRCDGIYSTVIPYHESLRPDLLQLLERLKPRQIALNYSTSDVLADGLSHGLYQVLTGHLEGTPFAARIISAEEVIGARHLCPYLRPCAAGDGRRRDRRLYAGPAQGARRWAGLEYQRLPNHQRRA